MRFHLNVLAALLTLAASTAFAAPKNAKQVFDGLCAQCHAKDGGGQQNIGAPQIAGLPEWYIVSTLQKFRDGVRGTHPLDLAGTRMAPMARYLKNEGDIEEISKFVAAMKSVPQKQTVKGSLVKGEARYAICSACHGPDGMGNKDTQAPKIVGQSDWYLLQQLKNFKAGARGGDPAKDAMGAAMRGNALALDDQAMIDVITYINALSPSASH